MTLDNAAFYAQGEVGLGMAVVVGVLLCVVLGQQFVKALW